ncbi:chorismate-binding protein [Fluviispira multicolorata]|uniref:Chorismate-utilising enzyme C-terminal domain-containing protein n=1 Tax=Fluviispira multicolorata TaxID=2654512 RepID=A0A833N5G6_9BACT|nr:chorismate-binding protein [Fluviispira multicolorata]KAB8027766.1 hypothetical protein GCL57_14260 [Fluviispira multicolorata]
MTNNLKISYKNKSALKNLDYFSQNILLLSDMFEKYFKQNIVCHFQIQACEGFEFEIGNNFIATNILPSQYQNIYSSENNSIILRFFCNTSKRLSTKNINNFYTLLKKSANSPLFFVTPYENSHKEESSYVIDSKFEVRLHISHDGLDLNIFNYNEKKDFINSLFQQILSIFNNKSINNYNIYHENVNLSLPENKQKNNSFLDKEIIETIEKAKDFMNKGDCYLANLTSTIPLNEKTYFISMTHFITAWLKIKSRYGIYYHDMKVGLSCFSPERFIYSHDNKMTTEPIKGTLKSNSNIPTLSDAKAIWADKKEIYEHTLVVDLMRNDLNLVCQAGSVHVYRPFYARIAGKLIQMQSSILGTLKMDKTLGDCLEAMLPAGSISGTPKKRVCEIISQLENVKRGYYTGICGILEENGDFDSTILIRSVYKGERGVYCGVGAGITTLSNAKSEYEEFLIKLNSFLHAIESPV